MLAFLLLAILNINFIHKVHVQGYIWKDGLCSIICKGKKNNNGVGETEWLQNVY